MTLFLRLSDSTCYSGTLRYYDLVADFDGFSNRKLDSLALFSGARRDGLIEPNAQLGSIGNIDLGGRHYGRHEESHQCFHYFSPINARPLSRHDQYAQDGVTLDHPNKKFLVRQKKSWVDSGSGSLPSE